MNEIINFGDGKTAKVILLKGEAGNDIENIEKTSTSGLVDTYTITLTDGTTETFDVTNGNYIVSIDKTGTEDLIDTYTITMADGSTSTFTVTNGTNGSNANLADVAPSLIAQKDYAVNEHLIYNEVYYIVTQAISEGDTLTEGVNIEHVKVGDEISFIANIRVEGTKLVLPRTGASVVNHKFKFNLFR